MTHATVDTQGRIAKIHAVRNDPLRDVPMPNDRFLLLIVTNGVLTFTVNNRPYHAAAPCFVCFHEQSAPVFHFHGRTACSSVYFHPEFLNRHMSFSLLREAVYEDIATNHDLFLLKPFLDGPRMIPIAETALDSITAAFDGICDELESQRDWYWSCRARSYFMELMIAVERMYGRLGYGDTTEAPNVAVAVTDARLKQALIYIESHYALPITVSDLTQAVGINRATLSALFNRECHTTAMRYLMQYRLSVATKHLLFTELPIKEIADRCGFKTVSHFSRCFRQQSGMTPAAFRKTEVDRRKATLPAHVPPLNVVFSPFTENNMRRYHPTFSEIITIGFLLDIGDIRHLGDERRIRFLDNICLHNTHNETAACEQTFLHNLQILRERAAKGYPIRIWRVMRWANDLCQFSMLCDVLSEFDCPISVVDPPDGAMEAWGFPDDDLTSFLSSEHPLAPDEKRRFAALWQQLRRENAPLRVVENGTLRSAPITYYDDHLMPFLPQRSEIKSLDGAASAPLAHGFREPVAVGPDWYHYRLRSMIDDGVFTIVPLKGLRAPTVFRRADALDDFTISDLITVAHAGMSYPFEIPPHLPRPQTWAVLSAKGAVYVVQNDNIDELVSLLTDADDRRILRWVTLWGLWEGMLPPVDLPSFAARKAILALHPDNADATAVLRGDNRLNEVRLGDTMPSS